ncbi:hypothetical protein JCM3765_006107 [Sporobolomyces pararoseus]
MSFLSLPPELLLKIYQHALPSPINPKLVLPLTLIHSSLLSIAHQFLFLDLSLHSDRQVQLLLQSQAFHKSAALTRTLRFDASRGKGIGDGGIGSEEKISGKWLERVLEVIEVAYLRDQGGAGGGGGGEAKLIEMDVRDCKGMKPSILEGESLKNLKYLKIGTGFDFENQLLKVDSARSNAFKFKLKSLAVTNNHWESLPTSFLQSLFAASCRNSLETLDLSNLYAVETLSSLLDSSLDLFDSISELYLPPFETFDQILFSTLLLDQVTSTAPLNYLELPSLSDPRSNVLLLPFLQSVSRNASRMIQIGFKNYPSQALLDSILIFLQSLYGGPPGSTEAEGSECNLERIRMVKILRGTAEVSKTMERDGELVVDLIGQFGCEVEYGQYKSDL